MGKYTWIALPLSGRFKRWRKWTWGPDFANHRQKTIMLLLKHRKTHPQTPISKPGLFDDTISHQKCPALLKPTTDLCYFYCRTLHIDAVKVFRSKMS